MKQNKYFSIDEFKCKCGKCEMPSGNPPDELVDLLVEIREHYDAPMTINSGYRCPSHNKAVGGASDSRHLHGDAVDFTIEGVKTRDVFKYVLETYDDKPYGIALSINDKNEFAGFVHLDTRGKKARWSYNANGANVTAQIKKELGLA